MSPLYRNSIAGITIVLLIISLWYFSWLVSYFLIAGVLSIIGRPLVDLFCKLQYKKIKFPRWLSALITLLVIWGLLVLFVRVFVPLIINQASEISDINYAQLIVRYEEPIDKVEAIYQKYIVEGQDVKLESLIVEKISKYFNVTIVSSIFGSITGFLGNLFVAAFAISFMTFFFLKDQSLFKEGILIAVPDLYSERVKHALSSIKRLLTRYFVGILIQISGIILLDTIGLKFIAGIKFEQALVFGLIAGVFNVIPYIGPIAGTLVGLILGLITHLNLDPSELGKLMLLMTLVYLSVQLIDNVVFQPVIYSSSVNAHPLEIFVVIMMAGSLLGVGGMILAVPVYTVMRVLAKEFFNNFKVVKKLTEKI